MCNCDVREGNALLVKNDASVSMKVHTNVLCPKIVWHRAVVLGTIGGRGHAAAWGGLSQ